MLIRRAALLMLLPLATGCAAQRDSADAAPPPGGPNVPVVIYGTWDYTMTRGDETLTGTFTLSEAGEGALTASNGIDAPVTVEAADVSGQTFRVAGVVRAEEGPLPFTLTGVLQGDRMEGESEVGGEAYRFSATRVRE